jgi:hypothetical protein
VLENGNPIAREVLVESYAVASVMEKIGERAPLRCSSGCWRIHDEAHWKIWRTNNGVKELSKDKNKSTAWTELKKERT